MFVRKKTKIRFAYALLTASTLAALAHDAQLRSSLPSATAQQASAPIRATLEITPLAESPFAEARPNHLLAADTAPAQKEAARRLGSKRVISPASVLFLTVSVQVNGGDGPIAFAQGTRVRLVRQQDGKLLVKSRGTDFLIEKSQATDDISSLPALARNSS